ncbi:uncharacterized protein LOC134662028 isoform X1 [Cydia amplana]|uniref:uncharacterized protein LOC134662028 isoform X1 n=1 Tax=Cydia amplana TaxID=1869771 RepID=UPI002FE69AFC
MDYRPWISAIIFLVAMRTVNVQFAIPMPMFQPAPPPPPMIMMAPPPPPVPVPVPYPVPVPVIVTRKTTTTTTTTQAPNNDDGDAKFAIPFPLPFGFPMPFVLPQAPPPNFCVDKPRPKQCPPCPPCVCAPSCTPAFYSFCSPCHQKCRCKSNGDTPRPEPPRPPPPVPIVPAPMPMYPMVPPAPGPVFIFPLPPALPFRRPPRRVPNYSKSEISSLDSSDSSSSTDTDSDNDWRRRKRRKLKKNKRHLSNYRKSARSFETSDDTGTVVHETKLVRPMLSYISKQGKVKFEKKISEDDATHLMGTETDRSKSVEYPKNSRRSAVAKTDSRTVIFSPPANKKITNLTVSFDVAQ